MKIAMIGTRGAPARYGGFETCVEEVSRRLADRGHDVTVYCRSSYYTDRPAEWEGLKLVYLPNIPHKALDTISHTFLSVLHALGHRFDVLMVCNAANSPVLIPARLLGRRIAINTDGLEWKRSKWGALARRYYRFAEWVSAKVAHRIVADSLEMQRYYREQYGVGSSFIAYGAYTNRSRRPELLDRLGVKPGEYILQITRFEPENHPLLTLRAFQKLSTTKKLVLVGDVPYASEYSRQIHSEAGDNVVLPGFVFEKDYLNEIWCNCYAYVHGNEVGGTNPALLQTMANGCFTLALDVSFNREVLADGGALYRDDPDDLARKLQWIIDHPEEREAAGRRAVERIRQHYNWDRVTDSYEQMFAELISRRSETPRPSQP